MCEPLEGSELTVRLSREVAFFAQRAAEVEGVSLNEVASRHIMDSLRSIDGHQLTREIARPRDSLLASALADLSLAMCHTWQQERGVQRPSPLMLAVLLRLGPCTTERA